jgi:tripartite-type tricarboxylate transporter receptor subunit TctC
VERLHAETHKALREPDLQAVMARQGMETRPSTPAELAARIRNETATWAALIKKTGIRLE